MSYILEALQKSEHERQRGRPPDLARVAGPAPVEPPARNGHRLAVLLAAALLLAAGTGLLAWQLRGAAGTATAAPPAPQEARVKTTVTAPSQTPQSPPAIAVKEPDRISSAPAQAEHTPTRPTPPPMPLRETRPTPAGAKPQDTDTPPRTSPAARKDAPAGHVVALDELPASVRSGLPPLTISGFASTGEAGQRMVVVNDRLVQEGEEIAPGLKLLGSTAEGAIFEYQGHRFRARP